MRGLLLAWVLMFVSSVHAAEPLCLTGNAPADQAARNVQIPGRYTYYDGGTFSYFFPYPLVATKMETQRIDEPGRNGGWVDLRAGVLTDGKTETMTGWPGYWVSSRSIDVYFDLGDEYWIDAVDVVASGATIRNTSLWLRSPGEERETLVRDVTDRPTFGKDFYPKLESPYRHGDLQASARWLRVNGCWKGGAYAGWSEIRIWGRPLEKNATRPAKVIAAPAGGKFIVERPQSIALEPVPTRTIFPIPQDRQDGAGALLVTSSVPIVLASDASERTHTTARLLVSDLQEVTGVELAVRRGAAQAGAITLELAAGGAGAKPQGYALKVEPTGVRIVGDDEQGLYYGTQALLQLVGLNAAKQWDLAACTVRDWPSKPMRYVSGAQMPTPELLRALSRARVTHYDLPGGAYTDMAIANRQVAEDRFVQVVGCVGYELSALSNQEELVERAPGEELATMAIGRRNPCPSHPQVWANYFAMVDKVLACNGEYVRVGMDEMYQPNNGARWNVCARCRARNLTGHELMADTIRKIHDYLQSKGKKTCIIDSPFAFKGISNTDDAANDWRKIAELLPKDILVYVWHPKEVQEPLHKAGYPLLKWGVSGFKEEIGPEYLGQYLNLHDGPFYVEQLLAMTQVCWSPAQALPGTTRATAFIETALPSFRETWTGERIPSRIPGATFFPVDLHGVANTSLTDDVAGDGHGFADLGGNYDLRALPTGKVTLANVPFDVMNGSHNAVMVQNRLVMNRRMPERVEIPLNKRAASLVFLHTLDDRPGQNYMIRRELCGYYFAVYADGKYDKLEIKYNINIANFDGVQTFWDYNPKSESLKRATLAWKGQTGAGQNAALYYAEWINPRPDVEITKIIFASTHMPVASAPVLIALTGVEANAATSAGGEKAAETELRDVAFITPVKPRGVPIDMTDGVNESDRLWRTRDGIAVECDEHLANKDRTGGCEWFWARASSVLFDNREWTRCETAPGIEVKVTLPQPRKLAGLALTGSYRDEAYSNDFPPSILDYTVEVTYDGANWKPVTEKILGYIPEEEGAKYHDLGDKEIKAVRVHVWRNPSKITAQYERGISYLQLFASE